MANPPQPTVKIGLAMASLYAIPYLRKIIKTTTGKPYIASAGLLPLIEII